MDATNTPGEPRALISREAVVHNVRLIRKTVGPRTRICAVVKADAYGHAAGLVVPMLEPLVDALAVATLAEAAALPAVKLPVLVLQPVENALVGGQRGALRDAIQRGAALTICNPAAADDVARIALTCKRQAAVQIMVDSGMTRAGVTVETLNPLLKRVLSHASLKLAGIYTHFACAEELSDFNGEQMRRFRAATDGHMRLMAKNGNKGAIRHAANSAATLLHPHFHLDMVRPGISLYGIDPTGRPSPERPLRPVLKWTAPLIGLRELARGGSVGYGQTWRAERDTRIGLVPVGYADGYLRCLSNRAAMLVHGKPAPVVGRVSMDLLTLDLGPIPQARIGDEVTILDDDPASPCSAYVLAEQAGTIPYELFCRIGARVRRVVVDHSEPAPERSGRPALAGRSQRN